MRTKLAGLAVLSVLAFQSGCSCSDDAVPMSPDGGARDGAIMDVVHFGEFTPPDAPAPDAELDSGSPDAGPPECSAAADCMTARGPTPCAGGTWECTGGACIAMCPMCTDADGDGYGTGPGCAGPDCDEADRAFHEGATRSCYSGPSGTAGMGVCAAGTESCVGGVTAPCRGEVTPAGEACNAEDDDCDGTVDEALGMFSCGVGACIRSVAACATGMTGVCTPGAPGARDTTCDGIDDNCNGAVDEGCSMCVKVSPAGNDVTARADSNLTPFRTIQAAIDWAAMDATRPRQVCVAAGAACGASSTYMGAVTMSNGISVYADYEAATFTRCGPTSGTVTVIAPGRAEGVLFPDTVTTTTVLDGFRVDRHNSATTAGITVDGATNAVISDIEISNTPAVMSSVGIDFINGGEALVTASNIYAGNGSVTSYGVRSVASRPTLRNNCNRLDAMGRCNDFCGTNDAIRGHFVTGPGETAAVMLEDSPGAVIEQTAMCGVDGDRGAGVWIRGDATGTVIRASFVNAWGGATDAHGIFMEDCGGASPWIVDNFYIAAVGDNAMTRVDGVRAIGDCHPVIDSNLTITGGSEGGTTGANGVHCGANAGGVASRCTVLDNLNIRGSDTGFPPTSVGVRCDDGSCLRIAGNVITGRGGVDVWGVWLDSTGTLVDDNDISGGCGRTSSTGIYSEDAYARIQNNRISAGTCAAGTAGAATYRGMHVLVTTGTHELDVHSNVIDGAGSPAGCTSTGVLLDVVPGAMPPAGGRGIYRNDIIRGGACPTQTPFVEMAASVDPRVFENVDLDPTGMPATLYLDEGATALTSAMMVDALADMTVSMVISADPMFMTYPTDLHIRAGSPCVNAGTTAGAPATDMDGMPRDATPDIGPDER